MTVESQPECHELTWSEPERIGAPFRIRAKDREIGSLQFDRGHIDHAVGEIQGRRWILERSKAPQTQVTVREEGAAEPAAVYTQGWTGRGTVSFSDGTEYCWNASHVWGTTWCFRKGGQEASLCVSELTPRRSGARVHICGDSAKLPEMPVLLLLGWYLRRLAIERLGNMIPGLG